MDTWQILTDPAALRNCTVAPLSAAPAPGMALTDLQASILADYAAKPHKASVQKMIDSPGWIETSLSVRFPAPPSDKPPYTVEGVAAWLDDQLLMVLVPVYPWTISRETGDCEFDLVLTCFDGRV